MARQEDPEEVAYEIVMWLKQQLKAQDFVAHEAEALINRYTEACKVGPIGPNSFIQKGVYGVEYPGCHPVDAVASIEDGTDCNPHDSDPECCINTHHEMCEAKSALYNCTQIARHHGPHRARGSKNGEIYREWV